VTVDGPIKRFVGCHKTVPSIVVRLDGQNWTVRALQMLNLRKEIGSRFLPYSKRKCLKKFYLIQSDKKARK
jgi:hypothetical protein